MVEVLSREYDDSVNQIWIVWNIDFIWYENVKEPSS